MERRSIPLRLTLVEPPIGVAFSLLDDHNRPVDARIAGGPELRFDFEIDLAGPPVDGRFLGKHVRNQNGRRFVYFGVGTWAGQADSCWSRRGKLWLDGLPAVLADGTLESGERLEARVLGSGKDGSPACATVPLVEPWRRIDADPLR
jgi:hypothetical protein